jgi:hypothetical protein
VLASPRTIAGETKYLKTELPFDLPRTSRYRVLITSPDAIKSAMYDPCPYLLDSQLRWPRPMFQPIPSAISSRVFGPYSYNRSRI